jgi:hypothetical protein
MFGGPNGIVQTEPCPNFACTATEISNLQHLYAMIASRYGAFYDVLELSNERENVPQTWVDSIGTVLTTGVSGIDGGNPADPYGHFFTNSYFPNNPNYYTAVAPYGPFSNGASDPYLNFVDLPHLDNQAGQKIYEWQSAQQTSVNGCPGYPGGYGGNTLPRFNGEEATNVGIAPSSQSAFAPNEEVNGPRIVEDANIFNQCGGGFFTTFRDVTGFNSSTPIVGSSWYDISIGRTLLQSFMKGLDPAAAKLSVTLGDGCASGKCSYAALGSSSHIRIELVSNTGNAATGVPNPVTAGSVAFDVPQPNMTGKWWNTANGSIIGTVTSSATTGTQTFTAPNFNVDMWFQLDP